jgi:radical SAM superfamily enzyme YgiQ (UPF0313 family)
LGLLTIAAMMPEEWSVRLLDLNVASLSPDDLAWADYVFISAMVIQRDSVNDVIARCKDAGVPMVAGGPLFTGEYERFPEVNHFVLNEAEITLPRFLDDLKQGKPQRVRDHEYPNHPETPLGFAGPKRRVTMNIQYAVVRMIATFAISPRCSGDVRAQKAQSRSSQN